MTRLEYLKATGGQKKDIKAHLRAVCGTLDDVTFNDFVAPYVSGTAHVFHPVDGTCRLQNHHGVDPQRSHGIGGLRISVSRCGDWRGDTARSNNSRKIRITCELKNKRRGGE